MKTTQITTYSSTYVSLKVHDTRKNFSSEVISFENKNKNIC